MTIRIPQSVKESINRLGNKSIRTSGLKVYAALYNTNERKNSQGFFQIPATYLKSIHSRYYKVIDALIDDGIIEYYKRPIQDPNDIFNTIDKKYYNKTLGICMSYRFLIDINDGDEIEIDMTTFKKSRWYEITKSSLEQLSYIDIHITRDDFGRRVHHNITQIYKEELKNRGYSVIDAKCSQPRLLYIMMKERGIVDPTYNSIFENGDDFYMFLCEKIDDMDRQAAKDLFMHWLNGKGYVPNYKIHTLFPIASKYIRTLKSKNYKNASATLQRIEAKIWIDDILENIDTTFALTIHDSIIVRDKDALKTLKYCKSKYPHIEFDMKGI